MKLGVTMGDASGVGPEILLRAYANRTLGTDVVAYGDASILRAGARHLGLDIRIAEVNASDAQIAGALNIVTLNLLEETDFQPGELSAKAGAAARAYVIRATNDALAGHHDAVVTLPMNKEATQMTDPDFCGHTELIAGLCGTDNFTMMLATPYVACTHVATHVSMRESIALCKTPRILDVIRLTHETLKRVIEQPRIAVCGLNPHAGENGLFGTEDENEVRPAVVKAQGLGIDAEGPLPADTVFYQAVHRNRYDAIVCMYHDQGHGPMKLIAFEEGVNVTVGLPIVRTSVDHGTAFDIAWQGKAFTESLGHACDYARQLIRGRQG
ncbi:MAG: 4-hydroxythreonine-4-phosphate dehydrogenase PdxA [Pseudomonadota bacterium]